MFEFAEKNEVMWPTTISMPCDGGPVPVKVDVRYKLLTKKEAKRIAALSLEEQRNEMMDHVTGWGKFPDVHGKDIPFSRENLEAVMEHGFIDRAIQTGWRDASSGAPIKNS